jgi:tetratricopeptide (TPR) repeat protein
MQYRKLLEQALRIFDNGDHLSLGPEKARAHFKRGKVLEARKQEEQAQEALGQAAKLYKAIRPDDPRTARDLKAEDFDNIIMFWSR